MVFQELLASQKDLAFAAVPPDVRRRLRLAEIVTKIR